MEQPDNSNIKYFVWKKPSTFVPNLVTNTLIYNTNYSVPYRKTWYPPYTVEQVKLIMTGPDNNMVAHSFELDFRIPGTFQCVIKYIIKDDSVPFVNVQVEIYGFCFKNKVFWQNFSFYKAKTYRKTQNM